MVSKSTLTPKDAIYTLDKGGMVTEVWNSVKVQACFTPPCWLECFPCNDGAWVRLHILSPFFLSLDAPKQNVNLSVSHSYKVRRHVVMGPAHAALMRSKIWLPLKSKGNLPLAQCKTRFYHSMRLFLHLFLFISKLDSFPPPLLHFLLFWVAWEISFW